ncbi:SRPBCC family protein [Oricola indica]|uniref:SRPBCC family protein n=1 Tax=Oricola indica TaxID=2872591 RepID=UPI003CCC3CCD
MRLSKLALTTVWNHIRDRPSSLAPSFRTASEDGTIISPQSMGMPEGTPDITEVIIELKEVDGKTVMTMAHVGVPEGSAGEGGWNQAFDKLADRLATQD